MNLIIKYEFPSNTDFVELFESVGWEREEDRIEQNRKYSNFAVSVFDKDKIVGMGRIVGDGCYFTIYDVVVRHEYQGKGIGSIIVKSLVDWYRTIKDDDTFLYLGASVGKESFYQKFGFRARPNEDVGAGMKWYED